MAGRPDPGRQLNNSRDRLSHRHDAQGHRQREESAASATYTADRKLDRRSLIVGVDRLDIPRVSNSVSTVSALYRNSPRRPRHVTCSIAPPSRAAGKVYQDIRARRALSPDNGAFADIDGFAPALRHHATARCLAGIYRAAHGAVTPCGGMNLVARTISPRRIRKIRASCLSGSRGLQRNSRGPDGNPLVRTMSPTPCARLGNALEERVERWQGCSQMSARGVVWWRKRFTECETHRSQRCKPFCSITPPMQWRKSVPVGCKSSAHLCREGREKFDHSPSLQRGRRHSSPAGRDGGLRAGLHGIRTARRR